ncbi:HAD family hydrolase [Hanstruepera flava]|uniref:HAD family hydrolase n=1 Tax=Hanstruepera flava TaxID=2930218 RepID=UPI002028EDF5|nr:HAD-IA family hydrolase [Hanstruepera flava]
MLKAVIFDMDGVIVDTEPLHHKAYFNMFENVKIDVSEELYQSFTGQSTMNICKYLCHHFNLNKLPEELVQIKRKAFTHLFFNDPDLQLIDGVRDLIEDYYNNNLTLILASSASMFTIDNVFSRFELNPFFKAKLSGADLKASKPHPEIFINATEASGYKKENCIVIEDSTNGIKAAHSAGIYCVGYKSLHSKNQNYSLANKVISDFKEIDYPNASKLLQSKN